RWRYSLTGFTITELLVAIGLLAAVLAASTSIFHYSIEAQRTAMATAEIMRTLRAVTDQLNYDFAGILDANQAPIIMEFSGGSDDANKADSIVFFAVGDFQTMDGTIRGNTARIYYGQSSKPDPNSMDTKIRAEKILARKQVILAPAETGSTNENEYEPNSLSELMNIYISDVDAAADKWLERPDISEPNEDNIPMYFAKGVDNFAVEFCGKTDVNSVSGAIDWRPPDNQRRHFGLGREPYPDLIKFTFTLYDSKGILKTGRRFEHIVYIGN
ncbi:MAG: hypothetical protein PHQ00_02820, partial [Phycisphaerae bacterium]|nr:hypothetical protein [Phycisphaerae bacterium]